MNPAKWRQRIMSKYLRSIACCLVAIISVALFTSSAHSIEEFNAWGNEPIVRKPKVVKTKANNKNLSTQKRTYVKAKANTKRVYVSAKKRAYKKRAVQRKSYAKRRSFVRTSNTKKYRVSRKHLNVGDRLSGQNRYSRQLRNETPKRVLKKRYSKKLKAQKLYKKRRVTKKYLKRRPKVVSKFKSYKKRPF